MILRKFKIKNIDPFWYKLMALSLALFFIFFADGLLSYWVPGFIQDSLGNAFLMGLIMAFSSFIGLLTDLYNPAKPANNLSMPPPPPKAPITQNNTELPTNDKPSHNDLMNELKKKFELLKGKTDEAD